MIAIGSHNERRKVTSQELIPAIRLGAQVRPGLEETKDHDQLDFKGLSIDQVEACGGED